MSAVSPVATARYRCMGKRPEGFIPRQELDELVALLCEAGQAQGKEDKGSVGITTALRGAGGFGKTTLAQALCFDARVRATFPDGILWTTLGEHPGPEALTAKVLDLLRSWSDSEPPAIESPDDAGFKLGEALSGQRVLLVVDDVWHRHHLETFLGRGIVVLATTRNRHVLPLDCRTTDVDAMEPHSSTRLLGRGLNVPPGIDLTPLAVRLGHWPLLLGLANARLRRFVAEYGLDLPLALARVSGRLDSKGLQALDEKDTAARERAVAISMELSIEALSADDGRRYRQLAIFPEDVDIPLATLARLWWPERPVDEIEDDEAEDDDAEELCRRFYDLSLIQHCDLGRGCVRLHDVIRQYLIDSQRDAVPQLHAAWLDAVRPGSGQWPDLPTSNAYAWRYVSYHLCWAGHIDELVRLLFDFAWLEAKLEKSWAADISTRMNALLEDFEQVPNEHREASDARLLRDALQLASHVLVGDPHQLPSQLIGRLSGFQRAPTASLARLLAQSRGPHPYRWIEPLAANFHPPGGPLLRTLSGHSGGVIAVAVTPDGRFAISASWDRTLKVWELQHGKALLSLSGHRGGVTAVAVTPDSELAISASWDKTLKVWQLASGHELRTLRGHRSFVAAVAVTPDGQHVVSASWDHTLKVWLLATGQELRTLYGHHSTVTAVAITPDGQHIVSASEDKTLKVWQLSTGKELCTLSGHTRIVTAVAVTPDSKRIISASEDRTLKIWQLSTGQELFSLHGHVSKVRAIAVTADGQRVISASNDRTLKVWQLFADQELFSLRGHEYPVRGVAITPDGNYAISASEDWTLKMWQLSTGQELFSLHSHDLGITAVAVTPDGQHAISASFDKTLKVWQLSTGQERCTLRGHSHCVRAAAVTPEGRRAISASVDHTLKIWQLSSGQELFTLTGHTNWVTAVSVTPDGRLAISASVDTTLKVWELENGHELMTFSGHRNAVEAVAVMPDGQRVISASDDQTLKVWQLSTGRETRTLCGHADRVTAVAVTPDGKRAVSASWDETLKVWALDSGELLFSLTDHQGIITAVAVTPDGERAISVSTDKTLKVWQLSNGKCLATMVADGAMTACAVDATTGRLIAGDSLGRLHILHIHESDESATNAEEPKNVECCNASADNAVTAESFQASSKTNPRNQAEISRLRILHISDLHTRATRDGKRAWKRTQVLGDAWLGNLDDITDDGHSVDLVAFTGDIADWGLAAEYAATTMFITATLDRLGLSMDRLFVVPGNHDINRKVAAEVWQQMRRGIWSQSQAVGEWLAGTAGPPFGFSADWADALLSREQAFWDWVARDLGRPELLPKNSPHGRLGYRVRAALPKLSMPIHIIGLDGAWLAGDDGDAGQLHLTDDQLGLLCLGDDGKPLPGFRLALMHHPLGDLADQQIARRRLSDWTDLFLRGHQHTPLALRQIEPGRTVRELAAGCLYEGEHGHNYPNAVHVIDVTLSSQGRPIRYDVRFRAWSPAGHWYDDGALYREARDGRLSWEINDEPAHAPQPSRKADEANVVPDDSSSEVPATEPTAARATAGRGRVAIAVVVAALLVGVWFGYWVQ